MSQGEFQGLTGVVLLTDHPWPGTEIECCLLGDAGLELREAPPGVTEGELIKLADGVCGILTCWAPVSAATIAAAGQDLRAIARLGIGTDNIDLAGARAAGATVTYVPGYCAEEVSDHVLALVLSWARQVPWYRDQTRTGTWSPLAFPTRRVSDLAVGVLGRGSIGQRTAAKFLALGCEVLVRGRGSSADPEAELCDFVSGLDVLTLHVPLRGDTAGMISARVLAAMRPGSLLVNTARGGLVDSQVLLRALGDGRPGFAALDVLDTEPVAGEELRQHPGVILTPHVAFSSGRSIEDVRQRACQDLLRVLRGVSPVNAVPAGR
jgi:D-3-phosphoglycerate dehydrogenase / 2-oxoglutarate reductase